MNRLCAYCGVSDSKWKCSRCLSVSYCSRDHQIQHWKTHKRNCQSFPLEFVPSDLWIFHLSPFLSDVDLARCSSTSKSLHELLSKDQLWSFRLGMKDSRRLEEKYIPWLSVLDVKFLELYRLNDWSLGLKVLVSLEHLELKCGPILPCVRCDLKYFSNLSFIYCKGCQSHPDVELSLGTCKACGKTRRSPGCVFFPFHDSDLKTFEAM
jgi:hypothetical protein